MKKMGVQYIYCIGTLTRTLVNSLHGLLNLEKDGLDCRVITTEYRVSIVYTSS